MNQSKTHQSKHELARNQINNLSNLTKFQHMRVMREQFNNLSQFNLKIQTLTVSNKQSHAVLAAGDQKLLEMLFLASDGDQK